MPKKTKDMTKKELRNSIGTYKTHITRKNILMNKQRQQIRHFRNRLLRIRYSIDYLLLHPFSSGHSKYRFKRDNLKRKNRINMKKFSGNKNV